NTNGHAQAGIIQMVTHTQASYKWSHTRRHHTNGHTHTHVIQMLTHTRTHIHMCKNHEWSQPQCCQTSFSLLLSLAYTHAHTHTDVRTQSHTWLVADPHAL